jgi:hypothetical protein
LNLDFFLRPFSPCSNNSSIESSDRFGRREEEGKKLVEELRSLRAEAEFRLADVRKEANIQSLIEGIVERFGWK